MGSYSGGAGRSFFEYISHDGYVWYNLCMNGTQYTKRANRLVAEAFVNNPENKPTVNHIMSILEYILDHNAKPDIWDYFKAMGVGWLKTNIPFFHGLLIISLIYNILNFNY